jgi:hypothetical protein
LSLEVESIDTAGHTARVVIGEDDLALLNNALNEVCNGVDIDEGEFATRLGADREDARALLAELSELLDALEARS